MSVGVIRPACRAVEPGGTGAAGIVESAGREAGVVLCEAGVVPTAEGALA
jgi:hypothetical protein